jgi:ribonucleoside-diphosphate reductase alpha chain
LIVGFYNDGRPGEIFINMTREGSTVGGMLDCIAALTSIALQSGTELKDLVHKFAYARFEPSGHSSNDVIGYATSIVDYVFRWLGHHFVPDYVPTDNTLSR